MILENNKHCITSTTFKVGEIYKITFEVSSKTYYIKCIKEVEDASNPYFIFDFNYINNITALSSKDELGDIAKIPCTDSINILISFCDDIICHNLWFHVKKIESINTKRDMYTYNRNLKKAKKIHLRRNIKGILK